MWDAYSAALLTTNLKSLKSLSSHQLIYQVKQTAISHFRVMVHFRTTSERDFRLMTRVLLRDFCCATKVARVSYLVAESCNKFQFGTIGVSGGRLYRPCLPYPINARIPYVPLQHLFRGARAQLSQKVHLFEVKSLDFSHTQIPPLCL